MTTENYSAPDEANFGQTSGEGTERTYVTKQGDTLEDIAAYFYGDPIHRQRLIDDNPDLAAVQPGDSVPAGMTLRVGLDPERGDAV